MLLLGLLCNTAPHPPSSPTQYGNIMRASFTCAGTGDEEVYRTLFSYYGWRFVQVTNFPGEPDVSAITGHFIHSDVAANAGGLTSTNSLLANVQHLTKMASLSNLMDVPTDCPQVRARVVCASGGGGNAGDTTPPPPPPAERAPWVAGRRAAFRGDDPQQL